MIQEPMNETRKDEMRKMAALTALSANYDQTMPKELTKVWLNLLANYSAQAVENGVNKVISSYEYKTRPPFAVLKKAIDGKSEKKQIEPEKLLKIEAEYEWEGLLEDISEYGRYKKPELTPLVEQVLRGMGGWDAACNWETSKLEWRRKEFIERYELASEYEEYLELNSDKKLNITQGPQSIGSILGVAQNE